MRRTLARREGVGIHRTADAESAERQTTRGRAASSIAAMTRQRFLETASAVAALGGAAWVTKVAVLTATDGDDSLVVGLLYLCGAVGITLGASWVGVRLAGERPLLLVVVLGALCTLLAFVAYDSVLDPLAKAALGDAGPEWFEEEAGILLTGLIWLAASLPMWLATTPPAPSARSTT